MILCHQISHCSFLCLFSCLVTEGVRQEGLSVLHNPHFPDSRLLLLWEASQTSLWNPTRRSHRGARGLTVSLQHQDTGSIPGPGTVGWKDTAWPQLQPRSHLRLGSYLGTTYAMGKPRKKEGRKEKKRKQRKERKGRKEKEWEKGRERVGRKEGRKERKKERKTDRQTERKVLPLTCCLSVRLPADISATDLCWHFCPCPSPSSLVPHLVQSR